MTSISADTQSRSGSAPPRCLGIGEKICLFTRSGGSPDPVHLRCGQCVFAASAQHRAVAVDLNGPLLSGAQTVPALVFREEHLCRPPRTASARLPGPVLCEAAPRRHDGSERRLDGCEGADYPHTVAEVDVSAEPSGCDCLDTLR